LRQISKQQAFNNLGGLLFGAFWSLSGSLLEKEGFKTGHTESSGEDGTIVDKRERSPESLP
jgi:hypothetical protein